MKRWFCVLVVVLFATTSPHALASRMVTLPFSLSFTNSNWTTDLALEECGGTSTHWTTGCYADACMRVTPPTSPCTGGGTNGGQTGLGWVSYAGTPRVHVRFLIYFGARYADNVAAGGGGLINKFLLQDAPSRTGILGLIASDTAGRYLAWGVSNVSQAYVFRTPPNRGWIEDAEFRISSSSHSEEWISVEYWIDTSTGETGLFIWDRSGNTWSIAGVPAESGIEQTGFYISYFNCFGTQDPNNYYLMDNLVVDDSYIGPPAGFVHGSIRDGGLDVPLPDAAPDTLDDARIDDARIEDARIDDARIDDARIDDARIDDARLDDARLDDARLDDARIDDARLDDARLDDIPVLDSRLPDQSTQDAGRVDAVADGSSGDVAGNNLGEGCTCAAASAKPTILAIFSVVFALWRRR